MTLEEDRLVDECLDRAGQIDDLAVADYVRMDALAAGDGTLQDALDAAARIAADRDGLGLWSRLRTAVLLVREDPQQLATVRPFVASWHVPLIEARAIAPDRLTVQDGRDLLESIDNTHTAPAALSLAYDRLVSSEWPLTHTHALAAAAMIDQPRRQVAEDEAVWAWMGAVLLPFLVQAACLLEGVPEGAKLQRYLLGQAVIGLDRWLDVGSNVIDHILVGPATYVTLAASECGIRRVDRVTGRLAHRAARDADGWHVADLSAFDQLQMAVRDVGPG